ncbi:MAG: glycosyl hydrolase 53 family protein [Prevotella sp.]
MHSLLRFLSFMTVLTSILTVSAQTIYTSTSDGSIYTANGQETTAMPYQHAAKTITIGNKHFTTNDIDSITFHQPDLPYLGGDISLLPDYEAKGAQYLDLNGKAITNVLDFFKSQGWNCCRVRLFVDPTKASDSDKKGGVVQSLDYVKALGKKIKEAGFLLMLDFHYSDSWADPGKQTLPDSWKGKSTSELTTALYDYTTESLKEMKAAGATPDFIQIGNEITYGMLWPTGHIWPAGGGQDGGTWEVFAGYLKSASKACREECPDARIIIHTELSQSGNATSFYSQVKNYNIDYDIIGLSYYPAYHNNLNTLNTVLTNLESQQKGKPIMIVETGYGYKWAMPGTTFDYTATYPYSEDGQANFVADLVSTLKKHKAVKGLFWWWAEANEHGIDWQNAVTSGWNNAALFDQETGKALKAFSKMKAFKERP